MPTSRRMSSCISLILSSLFSLSEFGRHKEELRAIEESTTISPPLARGRPDCSTRSLTVLSATSPLHLAATTRRKAAEAVTIYQPLHCTGCGLTRCISPASGLVFWKSLYLSSAVKKDSKPPRRLGIYHLPVAGRPAVSSRVSLVLFAA
jgi:hypothetical protein